MSLEIERIYPEALKSRRKEILTKLAQLEKDNLHPNREFRIAEAYDEPAKLNEELQRIDRMLMEMGEHD